MLLLVIAVQFFRQSSSSSHPLLHTSPHLLVIRHRILPAVGVATLVLSPRIPQLPQQRLVIVMRFGLQFDDASSNLVNKRAPLLVGELLFQRVKLPLVGHAVGVTTASVNGVEDGCTEGCD